MSLYDRDYMRSQGSAQAISTFSTKVYWWMTIGLGVTSAVAWFLASSGLFLSFMPFWWVMVLATLFITFHIARKAQTMSFPSMATWLFAYAVIEGLFFGTLLPGFAAVYGGDVIWMAFCTASVLYGIAAIYGTVTRSDLTAIGRLFTLGVMALMAITFLFFIISFFADVTWMTLLISYVGLALFVGLTAYDAQTIRHLSGQAQVGSEMSNKFALMMALKMYTNVIMIFWFLLQIFAGGRRD